MKTGGVLAIGLGAAAAAYFLLGDSTPAGAAPQGTPQDPGTPIPPGTPGGAPAGGGGGTRTMTQEFVQGHYYALGVSSFPTAADLVVIAQLPAFQGFDGLQVLPVGAYDPRPGTGGPTAAILYVHRSGPTVTTPLPTSVSWARDVTDIRSNDVSPQSPQSPGNPVGGGDAGSNQNL